VRILVLSNMYPPHHYGGYEQSCRDCVDRWRERGHQVTVLTTTMRVPGVAEAPGHDDGVRRQLHMYLRDADLFVPPVWRRLAWERDNQRALAAALADADPDVVSVWHMGAMSMALLTALAGSGRPLVYAVCDDWPIYGPSLDGWMRLFAGRPRLAAVAGRLFGVPTTLPDLGGSGAFCFVSEVTRRRVEEQSGWRYPIATVVYSGIDRRDFPPLAGPPPPREWRWRLLYVGRVDDRKGIETLIRAMPLLPEAATLAIVGRGHAGYRQRLAALVAELGLDRRVTFDAVARSELAARYAAADCLVFPSEWIEPFGLVPIEAMACATPVVATGTGGSGEFLVDRQNCLLFPPGDAEGLAAAVTRLAGDECLRARLVAEGLALAGELTVDRLADTFDQWHLAASDRFRKGRPPDRQL
jgi:glycogen synthase